MFQSTPCILLKTGLLVYSNSPVRRDCRNQTKHTEGLQMMFFKEILNNSKYRLRQQGNLVTQYPVGNKNLNRDADWFLDQNLHVPV